jgi:hypothetical protein
LPPSLASQDSSKVGKEFKAYMLDALQREREREGNRERERGRKGE